VDLLVRAAIFTISKNALTPFEDPMHGAPVRGVNFCFALKLTLPPRG
jgi:hypothetical protein